MHADCVPTPFRALIVEDEALIAEELTERLSDIGFFVIGAVDNADEGIAVATRERPDLILMDILLKGEKDGVRAAEEILQQVDASIVYLTAHSDRLTVDRASRTDHDGFILKPFHRRELQSTIAVAMLRHAIKARDKEQ
jgi:DNA-binding NarL/FixJ family response regulator